MSNSNKEIKKKSSQGVARATGVVSLLTLVSRVFGLVRDVIIASYFGAGFATDAFFVAFKIPNLLRRLVAEGSLSTAFVPIFTDHLHESDESAHRALGSVTSFTLLLTSILTLLGMYFAVPISDFFAPGFSEDPAKSELAASLLRLMFPYTVFVSLLALASSALNAIGLFAGPAAAPVILNLALIASVLFFRWVFEIPIYILGWGVLAGGFLSLIPQMVLLSRSGFPLRLLSPFGSEAVRKLIRLMLPAVISASVYQIMVFINTLLASMLEEGSVSWLYYADRIFQFPLGVFSVALATAVLPSFSRLVSQGKDEEFVAQLGQTISWISFVCIPATAGLILLANPMVEAFYQHGEFDSRSASETAAALWGYAVGLWSISVHTVVVRAYLAKKNSTVPAMVSCVSICVNIVIAFAIMGPVEVVSSSVFGKAIALAQSYVPLFSLGHVGLALAGSLASIFSALLLVGLLPMIGLSFPIGRLGVALIRPLLSTAAMSFPLLFLRDSGYGCFVILALAVPLGAATYFFASLALRTPESKDLFRYGTQLFNRFRD